MNKKILFVLCLFMFLFVLSSCNEKPKLDFNKAKANLEDEGYTKKVICKKNGFPLCQGGLYPAQ